MNSIELNKEIKNIYDNTYSDRRSEWRIISAVDKAKNLVNLTKNFPHDKILDIGAGDGSLLINLSEAQFGKEYHAIELTKNAVDIISKCNIP